MPELIDTQLPPQKVPRSEKDEAWQKKCIDALVTLSDFNRGISSRRDVLHKLYNYYNGVIDEEDYAHVLKPYGSKHSSFPAKLQNYPIIKPIVDLLLGEKRKRPMNHTVVASNADVMTEREEEFMKQMEENLQQHFVNQLALQGAPVPEGMADLDAPAPEDVEEQFDLTYKDRRAIAGQAAVDYIIYEQEVRRKMLKGWKHWLISGHVVSQRTIVGGNLVYKALDPTRVDFEKSPDVEFIEDGSWATVYYPMVVSDVIDHFHDVLTQEEIDKIEDPHRLSAHIPFDDQNYDRARKARLVEVIYCEWKSMKKVHFVTYIDDFGEVLERIEEEGYEMQENDLHMEDSWITEVWQGYRIDGEIYKNVRPQQHLRGDIENPSETKLSINGRTYSDLNSPPVSLVLLGVPYQLKYNIFWFRLENAIARAKDVISVFDINMVPKGWSTEKWMYFLDTMGIAWVDYEKEGVRFNPQHQAILDMTIKVIEDYVTLISAVKMEWEWVSGINRYRQGQTTPYDGKATTEQGIVQSSHITEELYGLFAEFEQRDLQALLDLSKYVWIEGKHAPYLSEDMRQMWLSLDGIEHMESEYGVFVSDAAKDREKKALIEQLGQAMLQNGASISTVIDIIDASNFSQIKEKVLRAEESAQKLQEAISQAEQQKVQADVELKIEEMNREDRNKELDRKKDIEVALIQAQSRQGEPEAPEDKSASEAERMKDQREGEKLQIERKKVNDNKEIEEKKLALANKELEVDKLLRQKEISVKKQQSKQKKSTS